MRERFPSVLPWLLIGGGTFIIQWHSIAFWTEHVNASIGWVWSVVIEAWSLWLWYRPKASARALGLLASLLLLAGPLYQIAAPTLADHARMEAAEAARVQGVRDVHAQLAQDAQLMHTYAQNSLKRTGWLSAIQGLQARMDGARKRLLKLTAGKAETVTGQGFTVYALVMLQAFGLVLIQVAAVLAITCISGRAESVQGVHAHARLRTVDAHIEHEDAETEDGCAKVCTGVQAVHAHPAQLHELSAQLHRWIEREGVSVASAAIRLGVDRPNLSYLLKWQAPGDRKPPESVLERIQEGLEQKEATA